MFTYDARRGLISFFDSGNNVTPVFVACVIAITKYLTKAFKDRGFMLAHSLRVYSTSWQESLISDRVWSRGKEVMNVGAPFIFFFFFLSFKDPRP